MWTTKLAIAKKKEKKKGDWKNQIPGMLFMLFAFLFGGAGGWYMIESDTEEGFGGFLIFLVAIYVTGIAAVLIQIVIHEGGHLVFGLLSGYKFVSFRVGSFIWITDGDKIRLKRYTLAGTGGQCLLEPPELVDGKIPVFLYNMGGAIANIFASVISLALFMVFRDIKFIGLFFLAMLIVGIGSAVTNGVPMHTEMMDNDGYNALSLSENADACLSTWIQLKANAEMSRGVRLKDMPPEWFEVPTDDAMKNSLISATGVLAASRMMDEHRFEDAYKLMEHLLNSRVNLVEIHRRLLINDCIFCEIIGDCREEVINDFLNEEQKKIMKLMSANPSIKRTEYVYSLLVERDESKAEEIKKKLEKSFATYPFEADIIGETELINIAEQLNASRRESDNAAIKSDK